MPVTGTPVSAGAGDLTDAQWIMLRLPDGQTFSRNGVTLSMADAVAAALELYEDKAVPRLWALADLWDQIATSGSEESYESESLDGWSYKSGSKSTAIDRAAHYRALAEASEVEDAGGTPGVFQSLSVTYGRNWVCDENSR